MQKSIDIPHVYLLRYEDNIIMNSTRLYLKKKLMKGLRTEGFHTQTLTVMHHTVQSYRAATSTIE